MIYSNLFCVRLYICSTFVYFRIIKILLTVNSSLLCVLGCIFLPRLFISGLLRFYQLLTLAYFVLGCIFAPRLYETLSKGGPMQLVIQLLSVSTCLQALGSFIMMIHLQRYVEETKFYHNDISYC